MLYPLTQVMIDGVAEHDRAVWATAAESSFERGCPSEHSNKHKTFKTSQLSKNLTEIQNGCLFGAA